VSCTGTSGTSVTNCTTWISHLYCKVVSTRCCRFADFSYTSARITAQLHGRDHSHAIRQLLFLVLNVHDRDRCASRQSCRHRDLRHYLCHRGARGQENGRWHGNRCWHRKHGRIVPHLVQHVDNRAVHEPTHYATIRRGLGWLRKNVETASTKRCTNPC